MGCRGDGDRTNRVSRELGPPACVGQSPHAPGQPVGEAVVAFFSEDEMIQEWDAEQVGALPESAGEGAIFWAGCHIAADG